MLNRHAPKNVGRPRRGLILMLGLFIWIVPFVAALLMHRIRTGNRALFESIMAVTETVVTVAATARWLRASYRVPADAANTGFAPLTTLSYFRAVTVGIVWMAMSIVIDLPLMLFPPVNMTPGAYAADVGLTYAMIPVIVLGMVGAARLPFQGKGALSDEAVS